MGVKEIPPRELFLPAELEEHVREHAKEFLARAVESAAKRGFAVEYKGVQARKNPDCFDCEYCDRLRYLKGEWHCRITNPHEVPNPLACFVRRGAAPNCFDCTSWHPTDHRCTDHRSQWAGVTTSPDNYCRFFDRRSPGL